MSQNHRKFNGLIRVAVIGGAAAVLGAGGLVLVSQAQDAQTSAKAVTKTASTAPIASQTDSVASADSSSLAVKRPSVKPNITASKPFRGDLIKGAPVMLRKAQAPSRVNWSQAMGQANKMKSARKTEGAVTRLDRQALDRTLVPVILPREGGMIQTAKSKIVSFGDAYALNMPQDKGIQITMYGNRTFVPTDSGVISSLPMQRLAGTAEEIRISQMEDGWTATFTRFGVVYSIDVSCDDINSTDCKTDGFIRNAISQFDDVTMGADAVAEAERQGVIDPAKSSNWLDQISASIKQLTKGS